MPTPNQPNAPRGEKARGRPGRPRARLYLSPWEVDEILSGLALRRVEPGPLLDERHAARIEKLATKIAGCHTRMKPTP